MEHQCEGSKMAVGSARSGNASQQGRAGLCRSGTQTLYWWDGSFMRRKKTKQKGKHLCKYESMSRTMQHSHSFIIQINKKKNFNSCAMTNRLQGWSYRALVAVATQPTG